MSNWYELVRQTAEYMPAPWSLRAARVEENCEYELIRPNTGKPIAIVLPTPEGKAGELRDGRLSGEWVDVVQEATARLVWDSPEMLDLLARWLDYLTLPLTDPALVAQTFEQLRAETESLVRRHVRTAFAALDTESQDQTPTEQEIVSALKFGKQLGD